MPPSHHMTGFGRHPARLTFLVAVALWVMFSWPLPLHVNEGILYTRNRGPERAIRIMPPGDPLQLLYRFALVDDMTRGRTPWFCNLYEFNLGEDRTSFHPGPYYAPFSLVFALLSRFGNWAFAWNMTGLLSLWLTLLFTFRLTRRFVPDAIPALAAALISIALPYRMERWMGGAPAGFAMLWVPLLLWGVDLIVRDGRRKGGLAAGLALWGLAWTDSQSFFFVALAAPLWALWRFPWQDVAGWRARFARLGRGAWPALPFILPVALGLLPLARKISSSSNMAGGRDLKEVLLHSPTWTSLFSFDPMQQVQVYLGAAWGLLLVCGGIAVLVRGLRSPPPQPVRNIIRWAFYGMALGTVLLLALGMRGPHEGWVFQTVRRILPMYKMIRHPPMIYCLMPTLMAVGAALSFQAFHFLSPRRLGHLALVWTVLMAAEYRIRLKPGICILDTKQDAYAAVARDAKQPEHAHALVLPLWPGDSHWSSLYSMHAMRYRIRMLNGYSPILDTDYVRNVFQRFRGLNAGAADDDTLDALQEMGIQYLLLHEDAYPEPVSPFPAAQTLLRLVANPRIEYLAHDRAVWAFRILQTPTPVTDAVILPSEGPAMPARRFHAGQLANSQQTLQREEGTTDGVFARLSPQTPPLEWTRFGSFNAPDQRLLVRIRGRGHLEMDVTALNQTNWTCRGQAFVQSDEWTWCLLPLPGPETYDTLCARFRATDGLVDLDAGLLLSGDWTPPAAGEARILPAILFFRAGYTDPDRDAVVLVPGEVPDDRIFYGPRLPLEPGEYDIELKFSTLAPPGTRLGFWRQDMPRATAQQPVPEPIPVVAGSRAVLHTRLADNRWAEFGFVFEGTARMNIHAVRILRRPVETKEDTP